MTSRRRPGAVVALAVSAALAVAACGSDVDRPESASGAATTSVPSPSTTAARPATTTTLAPVAACVADLPVLPGVAARPEAVRLEADPPSRG